MDIRQELTSTIMKMRYLAETYDVNADRDQRRERRHSTGSLINGLADEIEYALDQHAGSGVQGNHGESAPKTF